MGFAVPSLLLDERERDKLLARVVLLPIRIPKEWGCNSGLILLSVI
jgi:hypothetical protein